MAISTNIPDTWSGEDYLLVTMEVAGDTAIQVAGFIKPGTIKFGGGGTAFKGEPMANGGRVGIDSPKEDITLEFDALTVGIDTENIATSNAMFGFQQFFHGQTEDTTDPRTSSPSRVRKLFRISMLKTDDATAASAAGAVAVAKVAQRYAVANARMTKFEHSYSDNVWNVSIGFTIPPFKKDGTANEKWESGDGSNTTTNLAAYAAYTTTTNF